MPSSSDPGGAGSGPATQSSNYEIEKRLASTGRAEVNLGWQIGPSGFRRQVALKKIVAPLSPEALERVLRAASSAASLSLASIVQIYEVIEHGADRMIASEYVAGASLLEIIHQSGNKGIPFPLRLLDLVVAQICEALDYAYSSPGPDGKPREMTHGHLTPRNVLISTDGEVKLSDFQLGLQLLQEAPPPLDHYSGAVDYMSPEQAEGRPTDARSDVFSLGVLVYEVTVGNYLFKRNTDAATLEAIKRDRVIPPSEVVTGYPSQLETLVMKSLERDPERRFQSLEDFAVALRACVERDDKVATPSELGTYLRMLFPGRPRRRSGPWQPPSFKGVESGEHSNPLIPAQPQQGPSDLPNQNHPTLTEPVEEKVTKTFWLELALGLLLMSLVFWFLLYPRL